MRFVALTVLIVICSTVFSQSSPVSIKINAESDGNEQYSISVQVNIRQGWHIYASPDEETGIEPVKITYTVPFALTEPVTANIRPVSINDPIFDNKTLVVYNKNVLLSQVIQLRGDLPASFVVIVNGFAANENEFLPFEEKQTILLKDKATDESLTLTEVDINNPVSSCGDKQDNNKSLFVIFLIGFGGGLIALLTPCIFPMIPVTVGFFTGKADPSTSLRTKKQGLQNALAYSFFIFIIYVTASVPFHLAGNINPQILNSIATNAWMNVFFFVVFVLFALSFFGLFEIKLTAAVANKAGAKSGIFFMALTLVIVSFSCTGIILGTLLVNALSVKGNAWQLTAGLAGFGAALALPFGLFAIFPQWLQKLPKSGGWMDTVKKSLAFVELALAVKFLSNADLVEHWGFLKREVFIGLWVLIFSGLALYLFGAFKKKTFVHPLLQNADKIKKLNPWPRRIFAIITLSFVLYLLPGLTNTRYANLKWLSGFPPPLSYSLYGKDNIIGKGLEPDVINDYEKALRLAKEKNKPLLIDFTGWACVNCRKMEELVWTHPDVQELIRQNYVLVSLYVDDREKMNDGGTLGEKWAKFQSDNFKQVSQPLYVQLSPDQKLLNFPVGYTPDKNKYLNWLQCGIDAYTKEKQD